MESPAITSALRQVAEGAHFTNAGSIPSRTAFEKEDQLHAPSDRPHPGINTGTRSGGVSRCRAFPVRI